MKTVIVLLFSLIFTSCITQKKQADIFHRYARDHKEDVLEYCPPVKEIIKTGKSDTVTVKDTLIKRVPVIVKGDTIYANCPTTETIYKYIRQTDTIIQENTALLQAYLLRERKAENKAIGLETRLDIYKKQARNRVYVIIGLGILLVTFIVIKVRSIF